MVLIRTPWFSFLTWPRPGSLYYRDLGISAPGCWLTCIPKNVWHRGPSFCPMTGLWQATRTHCSHFLLISDACGVSRSLAQPWAPGNSPGKLALTSCLTPRGLGGGGPHDGVGAACMAIACRTPVGVEKHPPTLRAAPSPIHTVLCRQRTSGSSALDLCCPCQWKALVMNCNKSPIQWSLRLTCPKLLRIMEQDSGSK